jgi:predicted RNA-binding Zn-ribbon protein involved in translation (DUF1610 family)
MTHSRPNQRADLDNPAAQTHCFTCGKAFENVKYQCPICGEWSCSEECREKHLIIETMNNI